MKSYMLPILLLCLFTQTLSAQTCDLGTNNWEGSSNANPPQGWTRGGGTPNIGNVCSTCGEQDGLAVGFNTVGEYVISPPLTCIGEVTFDWHASGNSSVFTFELQWTQDTTGGGNWQTFGTVSANAAGPSQKDYMTVTTDLPEETAIAPFDIYVRFILTARSGGTAYIDNICFSSGTCTVAPTQVSFTDLPAACIQTGAPFTVTLCATDANGFIADTYSGNLNVSTTGGGISGAGDQATSQGCATYTLTAGTAESFDLTGSASGLTMATASLSALDICPQEETIRVMSYNILNFPNGRTPCEDPADVVPPNRQDTLAKIIQYINPDVLMVCELQSQAGSNDIINALQAVDPSWQAATFIENQSSSVTDLNNMFYYNSAKMTLVEQGIIPTSTRDISQYKMRMNDPQIATATDTVFIDFFVAHLKAGSSTDDRARRAQDVATFQTIYDVFPASNAVLGGDMNFYESSEAAYQTLLNGTNAWFDPANAPGDWDGELAFSDLHTQSSREFGAPSYACGINGGIDSRFDFLMMSGPINAESDFVKYIDATYDITGNNGDLFNRSINDPSNASGVPTDVLNALFFMSDHLPVTMDLKVTFPVQALPVTLANFEAQNVDDKATAINWQSSLESAFSHYELQRRGNRPDWETLTTISGGSTRYHYRDDSPCVGANYYRLRMVDLDGYSAYSKVETVFFAPAIRVFPTVTNGPVYWRSVTGQTEINVIDSWGRPVRTAKGESGTLDLTGLPNGRYIVRAIAGSGLPATTSVFLQR